MSQDTKEFRMQEIHTPSAFEGALWTACGIKDAITIFHSPPGCYINQHVNMLVNDWKVDLYSTNLSYANVMQGAEEKLEEVMRKLIAKDPAALIIVTAPSVEVTQDDVCVIPEIMVWDHDLQMCGLVDLPIFDKGVIHILDYKTNKKIESEGFMNRMMTGAFSEHPDCNKSKYSAQLYGYQKMACDLTGFKVGECWLISTASQKYYRQEDEFIECTDMTTEIINAFTKKK
jgi:hypothetical protein